MLWNGARHVQLVQQERIPLARAEPCMLQSVTAGYPLQLVAVDIVGPLTPSKTENTYILVAYDYFTRWVEAYAIPNQEAVTVAN